MGEKVVRRLFLADRRGGDRYLRVTWHRDTSMVVLSHWDGEVCLASTPLSLGEASQMIGLLVGALKEAAMATEQRAAGPGNEVARRSNRILGRIEARVRPKVAEIVQLAQRKRVEVQGQHERRA
jgi:hypothetical protein